MAVHALPKNQRLLEIASAVALHTFHLSVLAQQWVPGLGVIEFLADRRHRNLFPAADVVTGLATLRGKTAMMRIAVAVRALLERDPGIARLIVRSGRMALLAGHL